MQHKGSNKPHKKAYPTFPFLILQEQWDMFAFIASEFEQDNRPGEVRLGSAVSTGRDGWCWFGGGEVEGRWWHVSLIGRRAGKCVKGTLLTFLPGRFTPYIHDVSLIWPAWNSELLSKNIVLRCRPLKPALLGRLSLPQECYAITK